MAETTPRKRPGKSGAKAPQQKKAASNGGTKKALAKYHVFREASSGNLTKITEVEARNAELAVGVFIKSPGEHAALAQEVQEGKAALVVVPERNYTRVKATVETKTKVKLSVV